jgi:NhaC family Na+:H+ antiporter
MNTTKLPGFYHSLVCFGGIILLVSVGILIYQVNMHTLLLLCIVWASCNAYLLGCEFKTIKLAMNSGIGKGLNAIYIFILIGVVIASYIESGTIAATVYYALDMIHPTIFLPAGLLLCSFMSLATGTAWGTVGTVGVILMGIGSVLNIPLPLVAGMIISGASFGDKMSPVSDTTNLAAASAETDLYKHIQAMLYTTVPTYILCLIIFTVIGLQFSGHALPTSDIAAFKNGLSAEFVISPWALTPLLVLFVLSIRKIPAEPTMIASVITAVVLAVIMQDRSLIDIMASLQDGYKIETGQENIDVLLNRGGIQSMMWTLSLSLFALALGGILDVFGFLAVLLNGILIRIKTAATLVMTTIFACILGNVTMGEGYLSIVMGCQLFKKKYRDQGLENHMLSRVVEEGATLSVGLVPWSTSGAFYFAALGVPTLAYAPYAFLNYLNPIISIVLAYLGFGIFRRKAVSPDETIPNQPAAISEN